jgi:hypothetical protein
MDRQPPKPTARQLARRLLPDITTTKTFRSLHCLILNHGFVTLTSLLLLRLRNLLDTLHGKIALLYGHKTVQSP